MRRRAWLYCRVADDWSEETQNILEMQKAELERFCAEHDLAITRTSMVTGKGVDELRELFQHGIEQGTFDLVVTLSVSRLARDTREIIKTVDDLTQHGKGYCMVKEKTMYMPDLSIESDGQQENDSVGLGGLTL